MTKPLFTGVCTALVTPFINGAVNYPMLEQLLRRQLEARIPAVVLSGTTGEASTLSDEEKLEMIRRAKIYTQDRCLIIAGTGSNCTSHAVNLSMQAEAAGADALLLVSPYYNKANPQGLVAHYSAIASCVHIPCIIYNVPARTAMDIPVAVYEELANLPNIAGVKEASTDICKITQIRTACPAQFNIWTGNDGHITPAISLGAKGVISVASNIFPALTRDLCCAALSGDADSAFSLQQALQPLIDGLFCDINPIPVKSALKMIGFDCGPCRLPLTELSDEKKQLLKKLLHK